MAAELDALGKALEAPVGRWWPLWRLEGVHQAHHPALFGPEGGSTHVGGGIANTFMAAAGLPIGKSLAEMDLLDEARQIMAAMRARGAEVPIPEDIVTANEFSSQAGPTRCWPTSARWMT